MSPRFRLRIGTVEVESEADSQEELEGLLNLIPEVAGVLGGLEGQGGSASGSLPPDEATTAELPTRRVSGSTRTLAARLKASSGSDLVMAAAAKLSLVEGQDTFTRQELLAEMRNASGFYKTSYRKNLTGYLTTLIKNDRLVEHGEDTYALTPSERTELEENLAG